MTTRLLRPAAAITLTIGLGLGAVACGSDDSDGSDSSDSGASQSGTTSTDDDDDATDDADDSSDDATDSESEDSDDGDSAPTADPVLVDDPGTSDATLTLDADGFTTDDVTIPVGGVVEFDSTDGGPHGIIVGSLSGVSVMGGLKEWYRFDAPGDYDVTDEITEDDATVTVQ